MVMTIEEETRREEKAVEKLDRVIEAMNDYDLLTESILALADTVLTNEYPFYWHTRGDNSALTVMDIVVGAYWHYAECCKGEHHNTYAALCILGQIYSPGNETGPDSLTELWVYQHMNALAL